MSLGEPESLMSNEYYFKYIFKKTEKIVCAVFYILSDVRKKSTGSVVLDNLECRALETLTFVGSTLSLSTESAHHSVEQLVQRLVLLESELRVLHATGYLRTEHLNIFTAEIDSAIRSVRSMQHGPATQKIRSSTQKDVRSQKSVVSRVVPSDSVQGVKEDRKERIRAVLRSQPGASIKDISDTIKDCSEKTIQRELNDMIQAETVLREGEKRWSKYRLV